MLGRRLANRAILWLIGVFLSFATMASAAADTTGLRDFIVRGVGTGVLADGACDSPAIECAPEHTCECLTGAETILGRRGNKNAYNKGSLTFELSIDETSPPFPISTAGDCLPAGGFGTIMSKNGKDSLSIVISGFACPSVDGSAELFNGTYSVTTGTLSTAGVGSITVSLVGSTSRAELNGNVQP